MGHNIVKPERIAAVAAAALEQSLVVPAAFQREGIEEFKGSEGDAVTVVVEGVLPYRTYGWRNDRSESIQFDDYKERKVTVKFGDDIYSAVHLKDEEKDFDFGDWAKLVTKQTEAIKRGLEFKAVDCLVNAPYNYTIGVHETQLRRGLIEARRVLNALRAPGRRTLFIGTDWEAALLDASDLNLAQNVGEAEAVSALREATIGRRFGLDIVVAPELAPDEAYAVTEGGYIFATGAPSVPMSVKHGASVSHEGVAARWITDYDMVKTRDRSLVNTYQGFRTVNDVLIGTKEDGQAFVSEHEHFVRGVKLSLNGETNYATKNGGSSDEKKAENELASITGLVPRAGLDEPRGGATEPEAPGGED